MKNIRETTSMVALGSASQERDAVKAAFQEVQSSFEAFEFIPIKPLAAKV
jgi:hypothetical protein